MGRAGKLKASGRGPPLQGGSPPQGEGAFATLAPPVLGGFQAPPPPPGLSGDQPQQPQYAPPPTVKPAFQRLPRQLRKWLQSRSSTLETTGHSIPAGMEMPAATDEQTAGDIELGDACNQGRPKQRRCLKPRERRRLTRRNSLHTHHPQGHPRTPHHLAPPHTPQKQVPYPPTSGSSAYPPPPDFFPDLDSSFYLREEEEAEPEMALAKLSPKLKYKVAGDGARPFDTPQLEHQQSDNWPEAIETLLVKWNEDAATKIRVCNAKAKCQSKLRMWLGIPAIIFGAGTTAISGSLAFDKTNPGVAYAAAGLGLMVTILTALRTFLNPEKQVQAYLTAKDKYQNIRNGIEKMLAIDIEERGDTGAHFLTVVQELMREADSSLHQIVGGGSL